MFDECGMRGIHGPDRCSSIPRPPALRRVRKRPIARARPLRPSSASEVCQALGARPAGTGGSAMNMDLPQLRLGNAERPVGADAAESFTLPARFYLDPAIHELEKARIFARSWWYAGHKSQLAEPGCFLTVRVAGSGVIVVRDRAGDLRAFYNVCQHRGHELLEGRGRTNLILCPYHAWSYDLDGSLRAARNKEKVLNFAACDFALKP